MPNEAEIIRFLSAAFPSSRQGGGIGDDAAVLPISATESYVISKDLLVEHRHFRLTTTSAADLAHKALHVNLSDSAAMGAMPVSVLLGIALPQVLPEAWLKDFLTAFASSCKEASVSLIGGDTTASERDLFISVTAIGKADNRHLKFRSGAKAGHVLAIAGTLGEAHAGLAALEKNAAGFEEVKARSRRPDALISECAWFGAQPAVTAMMDVSDGLYIDLSRMMAASGTGAVLRLENLHMTDALRQAVDQLGLDPYQCMLSGGEDYALLIAVEAERYDKLASEFRQHFGYELSKIGEVVTGKDVTLTEGGKAVDRKLGSFSHFGEL